MSASFGPDNYVLGGAVEPVFEGTLFGTATAGVVDTPTVGTAAATAGPPVVTDFLVFHAAGPALATTLASAASETTVAGVDVVAADGSLLVSTALVALRIDHGAGPGLAVAPVVDTGSLATASCAVLGRLPEEPT